MKRAIALFVLCAMLFVGAWAFKSKTPAIRPNSFANGLSGMGNWWITTVSADEVDSIWKIDPEIESNYLPVPGQDELYMVIDENGKIIKYRHRIKQADGSWYWEDVNPDIPDNYEPVPGLENVYKVTDQYGNVHYYRYVRNYDNDTFAFVEVDENGNDIELYIPQGAVIPSNYMYMGENVYAVLNEHGVVIGYMRMMTDENGNVYWEKVQKPNQLEINDSLKTMDLNSWLGELNQDSQTQGTSIKTQYVDVSMPTVVTQPVYVEVPVEGGGTNNFELTPDSTFTETETIITNEKSGGVIISYKTTITKTYSSDGELLMTHKEGPEEVGRQAVTATGSTEIADTTKIAATLDAELSRITVGVSFDSSKAGELLAQINAERASQGLAALSMSSGDAGKLAKARAAALARYDSSDYINPLYADLPSMMKRFGISGLPSENVWRTSPSRSGRDIFTRFYSSEGGRQAMLETSYTNVGIAIAEKNGYIYVCVVYIN